MAKDFIFLGKTAFFPKQGILAIGDLHIGYDYMLRQSGVLIPQTQVSETIEELEKIFAQIKSLEYELKKVVFLGDIKHSFGYEFKERNALREIIAFLEKHVPEEKIIFVKGNHDTMDYTIDKKMRDYLLEDNLAFLHGHKTFPEIFDKRIDLLVIGHMHPSIAIEENPGVKREVFKCFLEGISKDKTFVVLPSFLGMSEGTPVNNYRETYDESFSIIPKKDILKFNIFVVGEDEVFDFGQIKDL